MKSLLKSSATGNDSYPPRFRRLINRAPKMESPSIPDNRPHKTAPMAPSPATLEPNDDLITKTQTLSVRSDSPPGQTYEPSAFGRPAIGRPPMGSRQISLGAKTNSESTRRPSIDQESIADSIGNQSLGHHSIGGQPDRQWQYGQHQFDQRSFSNLSVDQQSVGNQSLGHHSIGGPPRGYYS
jgi:hypothetical protein